MFDLLQVFEPNAVLSDDIWAYLWGKLGYGAMLFATALTPDSMSENFADPARGPALIGLAREVMQTAVAESVNPKPFNGFEPSAFMPGASDAAALQSIADLAEFNSKTAKTHTGIYRDLAVRKRKTEVDPQIGAIAEIATGHGINAPLLHRLVELIHDIEEGRREMSRDTFHELTKVLA
jgi:2-dehydropantoate 2-reductase